jgi:hypothetical protein
MRRATRIRWSRCSLVLFGLMSLIALPITAASAAASKTRLLEYNAFLSTGKAASNVHVVKTANGVCWAAGIAGRSSFRCGTLVGTQIYDPCFAHSGEQSGSVLCPTNPATDETIELRVGKLPKLGSAGPNTRPWAVQLLDGQVCVLIDAAWGAAGPFACLAHPSSQLSNCHVPTSGAAYWSDECQRAANKTPYEKYQVLTVWT